MIQKQIKEPVEQNIKLRKRSENLWILGSSQRWHNGTSWKNTEIIMTILHHNVHKNGAWWTTRSTRIKRMQEERTDIAIQ